MRRKGSVLGVASSSGRRLHDLRNKRAAARRRKRGAVKRLMFGCLLAACVGIVASVASEVLTSRRETKNTPSPEPVAARFESPASGETAHPSVAAGSLLDKVPDSDTAPTPASGPRDLHRRPVAAAAPHAKTTRIERAPTEGQMPPRPGQEAATVLVPVARELPALHGTAPEPALDRREDAPVLPPLDEPRRAPTTFSEPRWDGTDRSGAARGQPATSAPASEQAPVQHSPGAQAVPMPPGSRPPDPVDHPPIVPHAGDTAPQPRPAPRETRSPLETQANPGAPSVSDSSIATRSGLILGPQPSDAASAPRTAEVSRQGATERSAVSAAPGQLGREPAEVVDSPCWGLVPRALCNQRPGSSKRTIIRSGETP
jgi:hypothetical protein